MEVATPIILFYIDDINTTLIDKPADLIIQTGSISYYV